MATPPDFIAIARDIVQESCLYIPITGPEQISHRRCIFLAASAVKEMCNDNEDSEPDIAKPILYCALVVDYAAYFLAKHPYTRMSEFGSTRFLERMENMKYALKLMTYDGKDGIKAQKDELILALVYYLGGGYGLGQSFQYIAYSFERHSGGPQKAQEFIRRNHEDPTQVANLAQFLKDNLVSVLALRGDDAVKFLDILEKVARSDSGATADEKRDFQTYLRRLSYRSKQHPGAFQLRNVEDVPHESKWCSHSRGRSQMTTEGGNGNVRRAEWTKPRGTVAVVATKTLREARDFDPGMFFYEAAFWYYLDPDHVVPFYGVAEVNDSQCIVSLWMDGARICCYVDGKEDFIRLDLLRQVADGIKYLHDLNFVHCDIKLENILIDTQMRPKALITGFEFSNAARRANQPYSQTYSYTDGYVRADNITRWDPSNDVYAFGVTCCQVALVNKRSHISSVPQDIATCLYQHSGGRGPSSNGQQFIQRLRKKFFPIRNKPPPGICEKIFEVVANTCITQTFKMDKAIELLDSASDVARLDHDPLGKPFAF